MNLPLGCAMVAGAVFFPARLAAVEDEPPPPIRPTATIQSGDLGGLFFGQKPDPQKTRRYFVAAESVPWDFVPAGRDEVCGLTLPPAVVANREGKKLRYIQYTDETFTARVIQNPSLGVLGPVLRGVVGEFLAVTFLNRTTQPLSMHPHGVHYDKDSEGAYYRPSPGRGAAVAPGARFTYVWELDENSGPLPSEPSSKGWLYHSHVLGDTETNLGLIGSIIVTDPKRARPDATPADVDREFATLFMIFDESGLDPFAAPAAVSNGAPRAAPVTMSWAQLQELTQQGERYAINGYIFGNLRGLEMNLGERTRWYLFALGSETDFHTAHWHGLRVIEEGKRRTDVVDLLPATMKVADLLADNAGSWLFHCHVAEHMREGMFARLTVYERDAVGVSRAPEAAFLGLPGLMRSLRIDRSEAVLNLATSPVRAEIIISGAVTVPEAYVVSKESVRVQLGAKTVVFHPNQQGVSRESRAMLRVQNIDENGLVRGGLLEFELVFSGGDWLEGASAGPPVEARNLPPARAISLAVELGSVRHTAVAQVISRMNRP